MSDEIKIQQSDEEIKAPIINFCIFSVGGKKFSMPIGFVKEIIDASGIVPLPGSPDRIRGLVNLRGTVIPVLDMSRVLDSNFVNQYGLKLIVAESGGEQIALLVDGMPDLSEGFEGDVIDFKAFYEKNRVK